MPAAVKEMESLLGSTSHMGICLEDLLQLNIVTGKHNQPQICWSLNSPDGQVVRFHFPDQCTWTPHLEDMSQARQPSSTSKTNLAGCLGHWGYSLFRHWGTPPKYLVANFILWPMYPGSQMDTWVKGGEGVVWVPWKNFTLTDFLPRQRRRGEGHTMWTSPDKN